MNKSIAILLAAVVATAAIATPPKPAKPPKPPTKLHCAVMAEDKVMIAEATKAHRYVDYNGRRYFFCCPSCIDTFKQDPAKYSKSESIPVPPAPKPAHHR